ncbi:MAG: hemerythrin domain-containing protein [Candidatus Baltobacteraceae bacterium]
MSDRGSTDYELLEKQLVGLLEDERSFLANASNFAAFVFTSLPAINWAGFYFPHPDALVLGPFGGRPARSRLPRGRGVCGKAFAAGRTIVVDDVTQFDDHIACDSASRSEIVIPLLKDGAIYGVFDLDAPIESRFSAGDRAALERFVRRFLEFTPVPEQYRTPLEGGAHIGERIDIQTCRDHHTVLQYLLEDLEAATDPQKLAELLSRFKNVLLAHLRLEDDWLYPRLLKSENEIVRQKAHTYREAMGGLRQTFLTLWTAWSPAGAIAADPRAFRSDWTAFAQRLGERMHAEDTDLYLAANTDLN